MTCAVRVESLSTPICGTLSKPGGQSAPHGDVGTIAMLGTVLPVVKFSVEVLGMALPSPFHAVRSLDRWDRSP